MRLPHLALPLILLSSTAAHAATPATEAVAGWDPDTTLAIGARATAWVGPYAAPGAGGHIKLRPWSWVGVELFSDNFAWRQAEAWRHDHVIGFGLYAPSLVAGSGWFVAPTLGACVDFRFAHPDQVGAPGTSDILFGVHGGAMAEIFLLEGFAFELNAEMFGYLGHQTGLQSWSARVSNQLGTSAVGQLTAGVNYWF
ncbi:MAG: hypothetical protein H6730_35185 [Deltaproteobacteria bacterium]|nr:hypothetical protein [Deltaproteobacteria bacterium]